MEDLPTFATICDWIEGRLDPTDAARVEAAVSTDPRLTEQAEWLHGFLAVGRDLPLATPPPAVRDNLRRTFRRWSKERAASSTDPILVVAEMLFDSRKDLVGAGLRGGAADTAVHLAFTSAPADVVLDVWPSPDGSVRIDGHVFPSAAASVFDVAVTVAGATSDPITSDALGTFSLAGIRRAPVTLQLSGSAATIILDADLTELP
jgi:hypothetical protein